MAVDWVLTADLRDTRSPPLAGSQPERGPHLDKCSATVFCGEYLLQSRVQVRLHWGLLGVSSGNAFRLTGGVLNTKAVVLKHFRATTPSLLDDLDEVPGCYADLNQREDPPPWLAHPISHNLI